MDSDRRRRPLRQCGRLAFGTLVILLVWMYYAATIFFVGALITAVVDERVRRSSVDRALQKRAERQAAALAKGPPPAV